MNGILFFSTIFLSLFLFSCNNSADTKNEETVSIDTTKKSEQNLYENTNTDSLEIHTATDASSNMVNINRTEKKKEEEIFAGKIKKQEQNPFENIKIEIQVFNNDTISQEPKYSGYGYTILIDDGAQKIHQPHKPAVPGLAGFKSANDAKKAAQLVVHKIRSNIMPILTAKELDSLGILR